MSGFELRDDGQLHALDKEKKTMTLHIDEVTPAQIQLVKDLLIQALMRHRQEKATMTRAQVRDAWQWIEWLGGPGERL